MQNNITLIAQMKGAALCNFPSLLKNEDFSDVKFKVQDSIFLAHKCILVKRSHYFRALFKFFANFTDQKQKFIELKKVSADDFELCLSIIYGTIPHYENLDVDKALRILQISNYFLIHQLVTIISVYLIECLNCGNVLKIFANVTSTLLAPKLLFHCRRKIACSQLTILKNDDFLQLPLKALKAFISLDCLNFPEIVIFHAVQKWLEVNADVDSKQELLDSVRLGRISKKDFINIVLPTNLYPPDKIKQTVAYSKISSTGTRHSLYESQHL